MSNNYNNYINNISDYISDNPEEIYIDAEHDYIVSKRNSPSIIIDDYIEKLSESSNIESLVEGSMTPTSPLVAGSMTLRSPPIIKPVKAVKLIKQSTISSPIPLNKMQNDILTKSYFESFNNELSINNAIPCDIVKDNTLYMFKIEDLKETKIEPFPDKTDSVNLQNSFKENAIFNIMMHALKFLNNDNVKLFS
jgi:hypothetical protein